MSRVIAVLACGFSVAACSASMPSLSFLNSSPPTESVRFESEPPGAEVKLSSGQACRTPCEISVQAAPELSAAFTLAGFQAQTVALKAEASGSGFGSSPRLSPNPVYAELQAVPAAPAKKKIRKKPVVARAKPAPAPAATASAAEVPPPMPATPTEAAASATNYPWPSR
jgi:hypothetical protein